jgi:pyrimidine-nucleoside phosphorylase
MNALPLIEAKRDGNVLSAGQIQSAVNAFTKGEMPDYQMAALLMAIHFRGLDANETRALTFAMRDSGDTLKFPEDASRPVVDKHSTGGIGDKVSLPLAPLLACLGFRVPMISGRGLGITGGTLDKLDSIPGFRTRLTAKEITKQVEEVGCVICGQTERMCPADRLMYALRDATGTVPSIPLIAASILSKKLAEGIEALLLDVKFGCAAFVQTLAQARHLARTMTEIANEFGVKTRALLTDMNAPLGRAAGNWLEVKESVHCLEERGPDDLRELVIESAAHLLVLTGKRRDLESARGQVTEMLASGSPRRKWDEMLRAQGADVKAFNSQLEKDHIAAVVVELRSQHDGFLARADARIIGEVIRELGGGRMTKDANVDFDMGIDHLAHVGRSIGRGDVLCRVHGRTDEQTRIALAQLESAFDISSDRVEAPPRIVEVL